MSSRYTPAALAAPRGLAALASLASLASLSLACVGRSPDRAAAGDASADATAADTAAGDGALDATTRADGTILLDRDAAPAGSFCSLPGSVVWGDQGPAIVPGADASSPDLSWLHVPAGFCAHYFATVKTARQLRFAPGGELFVSSPTTGTTGAANDGISGIVVLPDDDRDGFADSNITFLSGLPSVQGLMFNAGYFYFQDGTFVRRVAYHTGDRAPAAAAEVVTNMASWPQAGEHWPRVFDVARDGTIYVTNGGSQSDACTSTWPVRGAVVRLNPDATTTAVAMGFRNPIAMRCEADHDVCLVVELALDYSNDTGGREKLVPLRAGDNWGYPCCATQNLPYSGITYRDTGATPDCSQVPVESDAFIIGHTPFGVDFETGLWPAPWTSRAFVTLHGVFGTWVGARVVGIALDPATGLPLPASELAGGAGDPNNMLDFATGWDDGTRTHGRPAPIVFAPDGRMFLGDDQRGLVVWIAPVGLMIPP